MAADDQKNKPVPQSLLMATVMVLGVVSGMAALAQKAADIRPQVGDVVAFDPSRPEPVDNSVRLMAGRPRQTSCVLDVATMVRSGGSLIVEQRITGAARIYHAHWAGPRTSGDSLDCGSEADLVLSQVDLNTLAEAAGGFGVTHSPVLFR